MGIEAGRVFCEHLNLAYRVALAATGDPAEAEDAVQDSYLRFAESWASFDRSRPVEPFLALIVARTASNRGRAESRRAAREETRAREDAMNAVETPSVSAEELAALRSAVAALPAGERLAVSLHYLEGLTIDDTAAALAVPRTTAANHVKKGLDELKKVLTAAGFGAAAAPAILAAMPRPEAPASLAAAVEKIVSGQVPMVGSGAGSAGAAVGAATKGGMAMKIIVSVVAAGVLAGAAGLSAFGFRLSEPRDTGGGPAATAAGPNDGTPAPVNEYKGMQEREEVFEFAEKPKVAKTGEKWTITFASKGKCDATVTILGPDGKVVRRLASGVLGVNAPYPFQQGSLAQKIEWDGLTDDFKKAPAGCKVRVSLGLKAEFEKIEKQRRFATGIKGLAVDKDGLVYVLAATEGWGDENVHVLDRQGKLVRTIWPPSAAVPPEKSSLFIWNKTLKGQPLPLRNHGGRLRFGRPDAGELEFFSDSLCGRIAAAAVPDGRVLLPSSGGGWFAKKGTCLLFLDAKDGSCPPGSLAFLPGLQTAGVAVPPDGKWIYFASWGASHAVQRAPLDKPGSPAIFVGEVDKPGDDNAHFNAPTGVACDKDGNVYVADSGNKRIQVFNPDGKHLKTIPNAPFSAIAVSHKTGAIYGTPNAVTIVKLAGLENPAKVAEIVFKQETNNDNALMAMDPLSDPPALWFSGELPRWRSRLTNLVKVEDRGDKLVQTVDVRTANALSKETGEDDRNLDSQQYYIAADKRSGLFAPGVDAVGPDGCWYSRYSVWPETDGRLLHWILRRDPGKDIYVPFEVGGKQVPHANTKWVHNGKPVIGIEMEMVRSAHRFQSPFDVAPNGDVYAMTTTGQKHLDDMTKAGIFNTGKPSCTDHIVMVYGPDGKLKSPAALTGLFDCNGLRVGRSGAVYLVTGVKPLGQALPEGLAAGGKFGSQWGSLVKFNSAYDKYPIGRMVGLWEDKDADNPTHFIPWRGGARKLRFDNSLWTYGGVSPMSAVPGGCVCLKSSFDLDFYERSFVPAAQTYSVNVIDANGNVAARLGSYGNIGDLAVGKPPAFDIPRSVAVTDEAVWVHDLQHRAVVKARLTYATEETVPAP
jgi:RNA polymerase sigma-70 factor (ECF subfamily)